MGVRIPANQAVTNKYTSGKEYMFKDTYKEYQGYYYELNGKTFAGKEFATSAPELIRINSADVNTLLTNPATFVYGKVSGAKIINNKITALPQSDNNVIFDKGGEIFLKFFCQKTNSSSIIIKEIDEDSYKRIQDDPLYKTTYIGEYNNIIQTIEDAEKQIPGLKLFLNL